MGMSMTDASNDGPNYRCELYVEPTKKFFWSFFLLIFQELLEVSQRLNILFSQENISQETTQFFSKGEKANLFTPSSVFWLNEFNFSIQRFFSRARNQATNFYCNQSSAEDPRPTTMVGSIRNNTESGNNSPISVSSSHLNF